MIDNKGIGNGTSVIIFTNIIATLLSKNLFNFSSLQPKLFLEFFVLICLMGLICLSQTSRIIIDVVSARQLAYLENIDQRKFRDKNNKKSQFTENGLSIRLNQAGIFPIIIASNLLPFFSYLGDFFNNRYLTNIIYYFLIIGFNYFYTTVFWDPEKISEQLRKASVSIVNITPGTETVKYLENVVRSTSIAGGISLCLILFTYDSLKQIINGQLLTQINISSLIILVGVAYEIQKNIRALSRTMIEN
jgi:preprotein translocase subunit SecY